MRFMQRFSAFLLLLITPALFAQVDTVAFNRTEVMIPVRDGVKLNTVIFAPKTSKEPLPITTSQIIALLS